MYTVGSAEDARRAVDSGVDTIVAHGGEPGSHGRGDGATRALLPRVVDAAAPGPVSSAGSIVDGRGMAAAFVLGPTAFGSGRGPWPVKNRPSTSPTRNVYSRLRKPGLFFPGCSTEAGTPRAESCATARARCEKRRGGLSPVCALGKGRLSPKAPTVSL